MSLVGELGRERFLRDALEPVLGDYDDVVIDTPPNLGLLTVNALVVAGLVVAPVSAEDDASLHGIRELRQILRSAGRASRRPGARVGRRADPLAGAAGQQRGDRGRPCLRGPHAGRAHSRAFGALRPRGGWPDSAPLAAPDSSPTIVYRLLAEQLTAVSAR